MKLKEIGWDGMDWITVAGERNKWHCCQRGNVPSGYINCREFLD